jgi:hypothetical protein
MTRYGTDIYGVGVYGAGTTQLVEFDASPFTAYPTDYSKIQLNWVVPTGDWLSIRLLRNRYGFPLTADDGDIILDTEKASAPNSFIDNGSLPDNAGIVQGIDYFYSLFVLKTSDNFWYKAGDAYTVTTKDYEGIVGVYDLLPAIFKTKTYKTLSDSASNDDLISFLNIFDSYNDSIKTYGELLLNTYDPSVIHYPALPYMMKQFGSQFEPELGVQQSRIFLRNISLINKSKGSLQGLKDFIKSFTGWNVDVQPTVNLMLTFNDSSFEESVGSWENIENANLSSVGSLIVAPYVEATTPLLYPNKQNGSLKLQAISDGDVQIACGLSNPKTKGIPVKAGNTYAFSIYTQTAVTSRKVFVDIRWYDRNGVELSRAGENQKLNLTGGWKVRVATTNTAPDDAFFAVPYIRVENCALNEVHYFDAAQFELGSEGPTNYQESRGLNISLLANRVNLISNPGFETYLTPWVATNGTITRIDSISVGAATNSDYSLAIAPTTSGLVKVKNDEFIEISGNEWYTLSGYVKTGYTGEYASDRRGGYTFEWYDASKAYISTTGTTDALLTEYYPTVGISRTNNILSIDTGVFTSLSVGNSIRLVDFDGIYSGLSLSGIDGTYTVTGVSGTIIQITSSGDNFSYTLKSSLSLSDNSWLVQDLKLDFIRQYSSQLSPSNAVYVKPVFNWTNGVVGQTIWIDSHLLEKATSLKSFFDGSTGVSQATDLLWEGEIANSRSHYYKNKQAAEIRLAKELPNYLYINQWFALYFANSYQG